eukprot:15451418-Alexandrium_andersonii.AAC.1
MADPMEPMLFCLAPRACPGTSVAPDREAPVPGLRLPPPQRPGLRLDGFRPGDRGARRAEQQPRRALARCPFRGSARSSRAPALVLAPPRLSPPLPSGFGT